MAGDERNTIALREVGRAVRRARLQAGLTQSALAERLGLTPAYLTNVEAGRVNITAAKLAEIADALGAALTVRLALPPQIEPTSDDGATTLRGQARRDALLESVATFILNRGVIRFSLRGAAAAAGTTHRVLLYHFGSGPELVREALDRLRQRRAERAAQLPPQDVGPLLGAWRVLTLDEPQARALLEGLAMAVAEPDSYGPIATDAVVQYLPFLAAFLPEDWSEERRVAVATLSLAVIRGLMLDWLATHDLERNEEAMRAFDEVVVEAGWISPRASNT